MRILKCRSKINHRNNFYYMIYQVLTATGMKIIAFFDIAPCSLVIIDRRFRCTYRLNHQSFRTSEKLVYLHETNLI